MPHQAPNWRGQGYSGDQECVKMGCSWMPPSPRHLPWLLPLLSSASLAQRWATIVVSVKMRRLRTPPYSMLCPSAHPQMPGFPSIAWGKLSLARSVLLLLQDNRKTAFDNCIVQKEFFPISSKNQELAHSKKKVLDPLIKNKYKTLFIVEKTFLTEKILQKPNIIIAYEYICTFECTIISAWSALKLKYVTV